MNLYRDLLKHASKNSGRVITKEITFLKKCKSIKFECSEGHRWEVVTHKALLVPWCPECNGTKAKRNTIEMMRAIAKERGGKCLSKKYVNSETKLEWQCSEGHKWFATPHSVKSKKSWCQKCKANAQKHTIEDMQKLAEQKVGRCLSKTYVLNNVNLLWECADGHQWENQPANITMGQWCPVCSKSDEKLTIEEMKNIAKERGGKCLSREYIDNGTDLLWECSDGHQWKANPRNVKNNQSWCPVCAGNQQKTIEDMKEVALSHGGELLSKRYTNSKTKLKWRCEEGHTFYKTPSHIIHRGQWCPVCTKEKRLKKTA